MCLMIFRVGCDREEVGKEVALKVGGAIAPILSRR
jgi:hypothetical protein